MIELRKNRLSFTFPEVNSQANMSISLMRTLRIPDDGRTYPLPAGLGLFPLRHIDDYSASAPREWLARGGVIMPMYQSEAMWISFNSSLIGNRSTGYPFAVKIATGKINAVNGNAWRKGLRKGKQNYMLVPGQPWLDGYAVEEGLIRQFVAMPLGSGYSAEEQITGKAEFGGLQICVYPMKAEVFEELFPIRMQERFWDIKANYVVECFNSQAMGLAPGGLMKQEIYKDKFGVDVWDLEHGSRCFVHLANSQVWRAITGENPPLKPITANEYRRSGIPWFDYYDDRLDSLEGSEELAKLKSVIQMGNEKGVVPFPEDERSNSVKTSVLHF